MKFASIPLDLIDVNKYVSNAYNSLELIHDLLAKLASKLEKKSMKHSIYDMEKLL